MACGLRWTGRAALGLALAALPPALLAHHSYPGYDSLERAEFSGVITRVEWGNPHIVLHLRAGTEDLRVEWITTAGAERTGVTRELFAPGNTLTVVGSRHPDPGTHTMAIIKEFRLPATGWHWRSPADRLNNP